VAAISLPWSQVTVRRARDGSSPSKNHHHRSSPVISGESGVH
jgi:hypothetical protein